MSFTSRGFNGGLRYGLGTTVLGAWLIATGAQPFVRIGGNTASTILSLMAIAAGILLLLRR